MSTADLLALPDCVLRNEIVPFINAADRRSLRISCRLWREYINSAVKRVELSAEEVVGGQGGKPLQLSQLAQSFPNATELSLGDSCHLKIGTAVLHQLLGGGQGSIEGLTALNIKACAFLEPGDLQMLLAQLPVRRLSLSRWAEPAILKSLEPFCELTELDLGDSSTDVLTITDGSLASLPHLPALRTLSLRRCIGISDAGVQRLCRQRLPSLAVLDLSGTRVTGTTGFSSLAAAEGDTSSRDSSAGGGCSPSASLGSGAWAVGLRDLTLVGCRAFSAEGLAAVCEAHSASLRSLRLCGTAVLPYGVNLVRMTAAKGLQKLDLGPSFEVNSVGLASLASCPELTDLRIGNFNIRPQAPTSASLSSISASASTTAAAAPLESLERLALGGMFASHGLHLLPPLPRLRRLELTGLDSACDGVLRQLLGRGCAQLQELRLVSGGPDLTPAGLLALAPLPSLRRLQLVSCPSAKGSAVQALVEACWQAGRRLRVEVHAKAASASGGEDGLAAAAAVVYGS